MTRDPCRQDPGKSVGLLFKDVVSTTREGLLKRRQNSVILLSSSLKSLYGGEYFFRVIYVRSFKSKNYIVIEKSSNITIISQKYFHDT